MEVLTLADDLTGAIEVGASFAAAGTPCPVTTELSLHPDGLAERRDALVVDTESRHLPAAAAAGRVGRLAEAACREGVPRIYKKTDSTLRGNIGAELGALASAYREPLVYVPAYPALDRVCKDGRVYVRGEPADRSAFSQDARSPVRESLVPELLAPQTDLPVAVAGGCDELARALANPAGAAIIVCDAETHEQLDAYGQLLLRRGEPLLAAGPGGFVALLAELLDLPGPAPPAPGRADRAVFVFGSLNETSLRQLRHAEAQGFPTMPIAPEELLPPAGGASEIPPPARRAAELTGERGAVILRTVASANGLGDYLARGRRLGLETEATHLRVRDSLGRLVREVLEAGDSDALVVFGGDTMFGVMEACGQQIVHPVREVLSGIPLSRFPFEGRELALVTKAGDFGPIDVVERICAFLASRP